MPKVCTPLLLVYVCKKKRNIERDSGFLSSEPWADLPTSWGWDYQCRTEVKSPSLETGSSLPLDQSRRRSGGI